MIVMKQTLSNDYLSKITNCKAAYAVWNILISLEDHIPNEMEREPSEDDSDQACFMVQGNDSLEVSFEFDLDG